nr:hypothetical protein [Streptomyces olivochromogenes]
MRRSYITHLIEDGHDPLFVQQPVGHDHTSTTAIYTCVSSDFRTRSPRRVLDATIEAALWPGSTPDATPDQLPVAPARTDGRPRHVHRRRADATPDRTRHHSVLPPQVHRLLSGTPERPSLPVPATRRPARTFLRWCMKTGQMPGLTLPPHVITQDQARLRVWPGVTRLAWTGVRAGKNHDGHHERDRSPQEHAPGADGGGVGQRDRTSAIRQLVLQAAAPVIAKAPGDHSR